MLREQLLLYQLFLEQLLLEHNFGPKSHKSSQNQDLENVPTTYLHNPLCMHGILLVIHLALSVQENQNKKIQLSVVKDEMSQFQ